ncbi:iron (metal) dependent repressor, DtxR family [Desulfacinum hydrothermale DSM 13146]|uniref:Transcriptional regulator MntR n=1 Tax=Desulfacinum hydrothermale DSM 13146 TaxID=1121390 RepID=A0A1W1XAX2_9BACT|nr:metal-dependent transcriptional regulator [Desulfacinum hydrothermale]SMC21185.1 iron (metal) dependent repressor, DtxR family [Desulfacinum hydrothermale DSM 13146]
MPMDILDGLSASLEDYLEVIYHLETTNRVARAKDIAEQMSVQRASVTGALKALAGRGLINYSPYSSITLTPTGRRAAKEVIRRHEILKEFFTTALLLNNDQAEANACRIEHAIGPTAVERLVRFLEFIKHCPRAGQDWLQAFSDYCSDASQEPDCKACVARCQSKVAGQKDPSAEEQGPGRLS